MVDQKDIDRQVADLPEAQLSSAGSNFSIIWLLPLVAALVAAWLIYRTVAGQGPGIEIHFQTAQGIEAGKTLIKYRDVEVGKVDTIHYAEDLSHVIVKARMNPGTESQLRESSRFWVERPRIGTEGISGLGTLISGAYIALDPGRDGSSSRQFVGLEKPPGITADTEGSIYQLVAEKLGSVNIGSPVYFRQIPVGKIVDYRLADNHKQVEISVFVRSPHDQFVTTNTRFWNAAGINLQLDAVGLAINVEALTSLLAGGIAFETPTQLNAGEKVAEGTSFPLYDSYEQSIENPIHEPVTFLLHFDDTVRGLSVGAPVEFRGIRIGTVTDIALKVDPEADKLSIPVLIDFEPGRMEYSEGYNKLPPAERAAARERFIDQLVAKGMRARLQTGNLITGQLFVEFDIFPEATKSKIDYSGRFPQLPTLPRPLLGIMSSASRILAKLETLPIEDIGKDVRDAASSVTTLINRPEIGEILQNLQQTSANLSGLVTRFETRSDNLLNDTSTTLASARKAMKQAETTLASYEQLTDKESPLGHELYQALEQLADAARAIRIMAEYLERHPEALIQGKR